MMSLLLALGLSVCDPVPTQHPGDALMQAAPIEAEVALGRIVSEADSGDHRKAQDAARQMQGEFRRLGLEVNVTPYVIEGECTTGLYGDCFRLLKDSVDPNTEYTHWHVWHGWQTGVCGRAFMPGRYAWSSISCDSATLIHEQGHNFGLHHTGAGRSEYGWSTWMGSSRSRRDFAAQHAAHMGAGVRNERGTGRYFLVNPSAPVRDGETHLVSVGDYYVSIWRGRPVVSRNDPAHSNTGRKLWHLADLGLGEDVMVGDFVFRFEDTQQGAYEIAIRSDSDGSYPPTQPFPQATIPDGTAPPREAIWHDPDASHQGLVVYDLGDEVVIYWFAWDRGGDHRWYLGLGPPDDLTFWRTSNASTGLETLEAGGGILYARGDEARLEYWLESQGRGEMNLTRLSEPQSDALYGGWSTGEKEGLALTVNADDHVVAFWFKHTHPTGFHDTGPNQEWLLIDGQLGSVLDIYEFKGGFFGAAVDSQAHLWGHAEIIGNQLHWWTDNASGVEDLTHVH